MDRLLEIFTGEVLGTMVLILLGNGVVANAIYKNTQSSKGGPIFITFGWAMAVFTGVMVANIFDTGGHINPAVTMAQWVGNTIKTSEAFVYFGAQILGAAIGQVIVLIFYWQHVKEETMSTVLGSCSTSPTHKNKVNNLFSEFIGASLLIFVAIYAIKGNWFNGAPLAVAFTVFAIGMSLGGVTGYAINPVRDLMPRVVHYVLYKTFSKRLNMNGETKVNSNWQYAWIPVLAPLSAGCFAGAFLHI